jgi:CheY-like chemotaxis protein
MIVFIDDDRRYIQDYIEELRSFGYDALQQYNVDEALDFVVKKQTEIKLVVLDMMIPSGERLKDKDKDHGRRTGELFLVELEKVIGKIPFPCIFFTHVNIDHLNSKFNCQKLQKEEYTPYELAKEINELMKA